MVPVQDTHTFFFSLMQPVVKAQFLVKMSAETAVKVGS